MKKLFPILILTFLALFLAGKDAFAINPPPAVRIVKAEAVKNNLNTFDIAVVWAYKYDLNMNPEELPDYFNIYLGEGQYKDKSHLKTVGHIDFKADQYEYKFLIENVKPAVYTILVTAANEYQGQVIESVENMFAYVSMLNSDPKDWIKITTEEFPRNIALNQPFKFAFRAESNIKCPIKFKITTNMPGNWETLPTGEIYGTPTQAGEYFINVNAVLECNDKLFATRTYKVTVGHITPPTPCATVKGTAKFEDGSLVSSGAVVAWEVSANDKRPIFKTPILNGLYEMNLPEGVFIFQIIGDSFEQEWNKDVKEPSLAERIGLKCKYLEVVDFVVSKVAVPEKIEISGRVTNENGEGLLAYVFFETIFLKDKNGTDHAKFETKTDHDGYYKAYLPESFSFRAMATSADRNYIPEFWEDALVPEEANIIYVKKDMNPINFVLGNHIENKSGIIGKALDVMNTPISSTLIAYLQNKDGNKQKYMRVVHTKDNGEFEFVNLPLGDYTLLSVPDKKEYLPGYYVANAPVTLIWKEADAISVTDQNPIVSADVIHEKYVPLMGLGEFSGAVKTLSPEYIKPIAEKTHNDKILQDGLSLEGVMTTMKLNDAVAGYDVTDAEGNFMILNLEPGEYSLVIDKPGFKTIVKTVAVDYQTNMKNRSDFSMEAEDGATSSPEAIFNASEVYPIPANEILNVEFTAIAGAAMVSLVNSQGEVAIRMDITAAEGLNAIKLDLSSLTQGAYFLRIENGGRISSAPISVIK